MWRRNYYEQIIRNEREIGKIWLYMDLNLATWAEDEENPAWDAALAA